MIHADMRQYEYYTYTENDGYGQPALSEETQGSIRMAIYLTSQSVQDNINFKDAAYVGFTYAKVDDSYVIKYGDKKLKVLYTQPTRCIEQVFMGEM